MRNHLNTTDSAAGTAKEARDRVTQAILPLRGKILNCLRTDATKALANAEVKAMVSAFGLQIVNGKIVVDKDKLRYGKIVIMTDGDVDGSHIRILLLTFIWKFAKELITEGYVYAAMPPLYKVVKGKDSVYLLDDKALQDYKKKYSNANLTISRFKGLGEMSAEQLEETTMSKSNRILKQIEISDIEKCAITLEGLMGEQVSYRKTFLEQNANRINIEV